MTKVATKRSVIKTNTYLPVFCGFYGTVYEDKLDFLDYEIEHINEQREAKGMDLIDSDNLLIDNSKANIALAKKVFNIISGELEGMNFVNKSKFESLVSPREYNFANDSIHCEFKFTKENVKNVKDYIKNNFEAWSEYLKENFTSYSGFVSFYENFASGEDWSDIKDCLSHKTKSACVLEFILLNENFNNDDVIDKIEFNVGEYITNYSDLVGE